jgi:hypothetical protein
MPTEKLVETFAIKAKDADRAVKGFTDNDLMEAHVGGEARTLQRPEMNTLLVVESTEEIEDAPGDARKKFAEAAGDILAQNDIEWLGAAQPR